MSEEINKHESELSEQALSNVSGAGGSNQTGGQCFTQATKICEVCNASGKHCSGKRLDSLIDYLKENGPYSVRDYHFCPYYTGK